MGLVGKKRKLSNDEKGDDERQSHLVKKCDISEKSRVKRGYGNNVKEG